MQRYAFVVGLRPDKREEYIELHRAVWPGVEAKLLECNMRDYTIWIHGDVLYSSYTYIGDDLASDLALIAADPETQEWWTHTDPCQVRVAEERNPGALWQPLDEVWHLSAAQDRPSA